MDCAVEESVLVIDSLAAILTVPDYKHRQLGTGNRELRR